MAASRRRVVSMSRTCGIFSSTTGSSVSNAAAIAGNAAFLAPLMRTVPSNGFPPRITNLSILLDCLSHVAFCGLQSLLSQRPRYLGLGHHNRARHAVVRSFECSLGLLFVHKKRVLNDPNRALRQFAV